MTTLFIARNQILKISVPWPILQVYITETHRSQHFTTGTKTRDYVVLKPRIGICCMMTHNGCLVTTWYP